MNTDELRAAFATLPPLHPPKTLWDAHRHLLRYHVIASDPETLLTWRPIRGTIAVRCDGYIRDEYRALLNDDRDWSNVIVEPDFGGNPFLCDYSLSSASGALVHQAYYFKQWLDRSGIEVADLSSVFEIGAGYGAMVLVLERLGFKGEYYICDLPEMELLCQYYLSNVAETRPAFVVPLQADLVVAIHSWSEVPLDQRRLFESVRSDNYLITFKDNYDRIDNVAYFEKFVKERQHLNWYQWRPEYGRDNRQHLVGVKTVG